MCRVKVHIAVLEAVAVLRTLPQHTQSVCRINPPVCICITNSVSGLWKRKNMSPQSSPVKSACGHNNTG